MSPPTTISKPTFRYDARCPGPPRTGDREDAGRRVASALTSSTLTNVPRGKYLGEHIGDPAEHEAEHFICSPACGGLDPLPRSRLRARARRATAASAAGSSAIIVTASADPSGTPLITIILCYFFKREYVPHIAGNEHSDIDD
jgi:hypothetical protein